MQGDDRGQACALTCAEASCLLLPVSPRALTHCARLCWTTQGFETQIHHWTNAGLTAFDLENPNPVRADLWGEPRIVASWPSRALRLAKNQLADGVMQFPRQNANDVMYLASDQMVRDGWAHLAAVRRERALPPFNLVVSDGWHHPSAVKMEVAMLLELGLIGPLDGQSHFAMLWDDCHRDAHSYKHTELYQEVTGNLFPILKRQQWAAPLCFHWFKVGGWIGIQEPLHGTCLVTTFDIAPLAGSVDLLNSTC